MSHRPLHRISALPASQPTPLACESGERSGLEVKRQYPIIITVRDRLTDLLSLLQWLSDVGQREVWLCDNASTYEPMVKFLANTTHRVVYNHQNLGHRAPWLSGLVAELGDNQPFVVTDPDVVPCETCPHDALDYFWDTLQVHSDMDKVGFSLRIDDLPEHFAHRDSVVLWERQFWTNQFKPGFFFAPIDTTFAVYRPGLGHRNSRSLRAHAPYEARHMPWYDNSASPTVEQEYYVKHADHLISNWNSDRIPANVRAKLQHLGNNGTTRP